MRKILLCICVLGCSSTSSNQSDGTKSLQSGLAAAVSLGQTSSLAMQAMTSSTTCASVTTACPTFPCNNGAVTIDYGSGCPLPLGGAATGQVNVSGSWMSAMSATLSDTFVGVMAGNKSDVVVNAKNLTVSRSGQIITVSYNLQDVNVASGVENFGQSSWTVTVDIGTTPGDPSDDKYTITGGNQGVSTGISQLSVSNVMVDPSCQKNPVSGTATVQNVSAFNLEDDVLTFHSTCDGKADNSTGGSITLNFLH
jgi:hypothetical protein